MIRFLCLAVAIVVSGYAYAGETSVLVNKEAEAKPAVAVVNPCKGRCCRLYNVEETCTESCRNRLFGGHVKKTTVRKVYRPAR